MKCSLMPVYRPPENNELFYKTHVKHQNGKAINKTVVYIRVQDISAFAHCENVFIEEKSTYVYSNLHGYLITRPPKN